MHNSFTIFYNKLRVTAFNTVFSQTANAFANGENFFEYIKLNTTGGATEYIALETEYGGVCNKDKNVCDLVMLAKLKSINTFVINGIGFCSSQNGEYNNYATFSEPLNFTGGEAVIYAKVIISFQPDNDSFTANADFLKRLVGLNAPKTIEIGFSDSERKLMDIARCDNVAPITETFSENGYSVPITSGSPVSKKFCSLFFDRKPVLKIEADENIDENLNFSTLKNNSVNLADPYADYAVTAIDGITANDVDYAVRKVSKGGIIKEKAKFMFPPQKIKTDYSGKITAVLSTDGLTLYKADDYTPISPFSTDFFGQSVSDFYPCALNGIVVYTNGNVRKWTVNAELNAVTSNLLFSATDFTRGFISSDGVFVTLISSSEVCVYKLVGGNYTQYLQYGMPTAFVASFDGETNTLAVACAQKVFQIRFKNGMHAYTERSTSLLSYGNRTIENSYSIIAYARPSTVIYRNLFTGLATTSSEVGMTDSVFSEGMKYLLVGANGELKLYYINRYSLSKEPLMSGLVGDLSNYFLTCESLYKVDGGKTIRYRLEQNCRDVVILKSGANSVTAVKTVKCFGANKTLNIEVSV